MDGTAFWRWVFMELNNKKMKGANMKSKILISVYTAFVLILNCAAGVHANDYIYKAYDFEDFVTKEQGMPSGMQAFGYVVAGDDGSHTGKYINFKDAQLLKITVPADLKTGSGNFLVSADIRITNASSAGYVFGFAQYSAPQSTYISFTADRKVKVGSTELASYAINTWYTVQALIDRTANTADVFLNGQIIADDIAWTWNQSYNYMLNSPMSLGGAYTFNLDNLIFTDDPQYFPEEKEYFGIEYATPQDGAVDVPLFTTVKIKFEQAIDSSTYTDDEPPINLTGGAYQIQDLSFDDEMKELSAELTGLDYASVYTINFNENLKSVEGAYINSLLKVSFSTECFYEINTFDKQVTSDPDDITNKVYNVSAAGSMTNSGVDRIAMSEAKGNTVTVSMQIYIPTEADLKYLSMCPVTSEGKNNNTMLLMSDGTVRYPSSESTPVVGANSQEILWKKGQWHTVSFVINTNTGKGSYYLNGYPIALNTSGNFATVKYINISPIGTGNVYVDNVSITNNPQKTVDTNFTISGSMPQDGEKDVYSDNPTIYIDFNKRIDESTLTNSGFTLTGGEKAVDISDIRLINGDKTVALKLNGQLDPNTEYILTVSGIISEYGVAMTGDNTISFTVESYVKISDIEFFDESGAPLTILDSGIVKISASAENFTFEAAKATLLIALCKGDEDCFYVEELITSQSGDIAQGDTEILEGKINVRDTENHFIKALVWDSIDGMNSLHIFKNLYAQEN